MYFIEEMRQRLGYEEDDSTHDKEIAAMSPMERVRLIAGWELGDASWADTFRYWCESQNLYLTKSGSGRVID